MPQTLDLRRRMTAVSQTKKITGAMQIVSSTRMKRVMSRIEYNHRYFNTVQRTMKELLLSSRDISHPYLDDSRGNRRTCIVISGDKGLAGDYNAKVLEFALQYLQPQEEGGGLVTLGHTADAFFEARGITPDVSYSGVVQDPTLDRARGMLYDVLRMYESGLADEILVIYTSFYGETKNQPVMRRLLQTMATSSRRRSSRKSSTSPRRRWYLTCWCPSMCWGFSLACWCRPMPASTMPA